MWTENVLHMDWFIYLLTNNFRKWPLERTIIHSQNVTHQHLKKIKMTLSDISINIMFSQYNKNLQD